VRGVNYFRPERSPIWFCFVQFGLFFDVVTHTAQHPSSPIPLLRAAFIVTKPIPLPCGAMGFLQTTTVLTLDLVFTQMNWRSLQICVV
jgi:hypothetical protein